MHSLRVFGFTSPQLISGGSMGSDAAGWTIDEADLREPKTAIKVQNGRVAACCDGFPWQRTGESLTRVVVVPAVGPSLPNLHRFRAAKHRFFGSASDVCSDGLPETEPIVGSFAPSCGHETNVGSPSSHSTIVARPAPLRDSGLPTGHGIGWKIPSKLNRRLSEK